MTTKGGRPARGADGFRGQAIKEQRRIDIDQRPGGDGRAATELAWLVVGCVTLAAVAMQLKLVDRVFDWAPDNLNMNGVIALLIAIPVAATLFARRRYDEANAVRVELARLSLHDALTGLPNRLYLADWLDQDLHRAAQENSKVAVLFLDLDKFKIVNDTYGHEVGDELMVAVAHRLGTLLRDVDRIVRYGGDEFVVICPEVTSAQSAERIAGRMIEALESPFTIGADSIRISTSIGIALAEDREVHPDEVLRDADVAMYHAKAEGSGRYVIFDRSMHGVLTPATAESRLRQALDEGQFELFYQPVVNVHEGRMIGVEALLRWNDPERGRVAPSEFLPIMEETGLIVPVGAWVTQEACRQAASWRDRYPDRPPLKVTVNVSARQLAQVDFKDVVATALRDSGVTHEQICLEITEGALMFDVSTAWSVLRHIKTLGVSLALDDFGTGYSSLSYVRRFRLDMLKVDKSFVDGLGSSPADTAIVEHVLGLANALGMVTVIEGIEHVEQLTELCRIGGELAQGYLFSEPVQAHCIDAILEDPSVELGWSTFTDAQRPSSNVERAASKRPVGAGAPLLVAAPVPAPAAPAAMLPDAPLSPPPPMSMPEPVGPAGAPHPPPPVPPTEQPEDPHDAGPLLPRFREFRPAGAEPDDPSHDPTLV